METTKKRWQEKMVELTTAVFMRWCDVIEGGALRNIAISRAKLDDIVEQSRVLCEDYVYCRLQVSPPTRHTHHRQVRPTGWPQKLAVKQFRKSVNI